MVIRRVLDWLVDALMVIGSVSIVLMMFVVMSDAVARGLFGASVPGAEELTSNYFMVAVTFLPLACVQREKNHIIIELFTSGLSPRTIAAIDAIVYFLCGIGALIYCYAAFGKAVAMTRADEYAVGTILVTIWPTRWMLVIGMLVLALYLLLQAIDDARTALGRGPPDLTDTSGPGVAHR
ncbi:MAG: TRAP transporter small permease [Pseudolabrys sp.]|nr:TRAP transporter small permease [Pseudolabrys sp.]